MVIAMFLVPLGYAVWMFQSGWRPAQLSNNGELISPPLPAAALTLSGQVGGELEANWLAAGRWTLVLSQSGACGESCLRALVDSRQVRLALGKDSPRLQRLLLIDQRLPEEVVLEHPDLVIARQSADSPFARDGSIWVVDPLGNAMLRYRRGFEAKGLLEDLRRLFKLSQIG
jgi:hypothetical protein